MTTHTDIGGSSMGRIVNCPASVSLSAPYSDTGSSVFAELGTAKHQAMEVLWQMNQCTDPEPIRGRTYNDHEMDDDAMHDIARACVALRTVLGDVSEVKIEVSSEFPGLGVTARGTADVVFRNGENKAGIVDYKFGHTHVPAKDNYQLAFYLWATINNPDLAYMFENVEVFTCAIIQPALNGDMADIWEVTRDELAVLVAEMQRAAAKAYGPDPAIKEGDHCQFCKAKPSCPLKMEAARYAFQRTAKQVNDLNEAMSMVETLEEWAKAVRAETHTCLENGTAVEGWKLVAKRANRNWADDMAAEAFYAKHGVNCHAPLKLKSPAQMEKYCSLEIPETVKESSGTTIAKADDKREAVVLNLGAIRNVLKKAL